MSAVEARGVSATDACGSGRLQPADYWRYCFRKALGPRRRQPYTHSREERVALLPGPYPNAGLARAGAAVSLYSSLSSISPPKERADEAT
jgi:hypothetical protein